MKSYLDIVSEILATGSITPQRAKVKGEPVNMRLLPGLVFRHDLREGFPLLTTKRVHFKAVARELEMFIKGEHRKEFLHAAGVTIWDEWKMPNQDDPNELGPIYGVQWRNWISLDPDADLDCFPGHIDQLSVLLETLKTNPYDRRTVVSAWNVGDLGRMALPPCHVLWQTVTTKNGAGAHVLNLCMTMRSADVMLGVPYNVASYALLLLLLAKHTGMVPGTLTVTINNAHIYENHIPQAREQLDRAPRILPKVVIPDREDGQPFDMRTWTYHDIELTGYDPHPALKMEIAI